MIISSPSILYFLFRFEALHDDYVTDIACAFDGTQTWLLSASTDHTVKKTLLE